MKTLLPLLSLACLLGLAACKPAQEEPATSTEITAQTTEPVSLEGAQPTIDLERMMERPAFKRANQQGEPMQLPSRD